MALPGLTNVASAATPWAPPASPSTTAPFNECPAIGQDTTGCGLLIILNSNGTATIKDSGQKPYDGNDDSLVGVLNNTGYAISSMALSSSLDIFGFDGDGICSNSYKGGWKVGGSAVTNSCAYESTGYAGPNISYSGISSDKKSGTVNFAGGLSAGGSLMFSLENKLSGSNFRIPVLSGFTTAPTPGSLTYGSSLVDQATLTGDQAGGTPVGAITFWACHAASCTSGGAQVGSPVTVSGSGVTATASSSSFTPDAVGTWCFRAVFNPTNSNYSQATDVNLNECFDVAPAALQITASSGDFTYGGTPITITPNYAGFVNGDSASSLATAPTCSTTATSSSPVGTYPSTCTGAVDGNYTISYVPGTVTVDPAPLTVTASSAGFHYGDVPPLITPLYSGLVNGDTGPETAPTCSTTATNSSPVGTYPSTCSGAVDDNYSFTYVPGVVTVTMATNPLVITASSGAFVQGGTPPAVTPSYSGFVGGDTASSLTTPPTCTTTATSSSPPGTYATLCTGAVDPNYVINYVAGTITVSAPPTPPTGGGGSSSTTTSTTSPSTGVPVSEATTVHTGESFAGSRPYVLTTLGTGFGLVSIGLIKRRRTRAHASR